MKKKHYILSLLCLIFISLNLRAPITVIGPIVGEIMQEYKLSSTSIGILSSLPLFCFFVFSLITPLLHSVRACFGAILLIIIGLYLRSLTNVNMLFFGTFLIGVAIAVLNVLMPSFIKNNFKQIAKYTALYGMFLSISSLIGVFGHYFIDYIGLSNTLLCWIIFAIIALLCYLPFIKNKRFLKAQNIQNFKDFLSIFKNKKAWIITAFMGLQSCVFYTITAWYPSIIAVSLGDRIATNIVLFFQFCAIFSAYFIPNFMHKTKKKALLLVFICLCNVSAFFVCLITTNLYILCFSAALFSIPVGGIFGVALIMISTKSKDLKTTIYLSSMAQSVGYLIATIGPIVFGYLKDINGNFNFSIIFMIITSFVLLIFALLSNKIRNI